LGAFWLNCRIEQPASQATPRASHANAALIECIRAELAAGGPVTFRRFMELALYHPEHGYYASGRAAIGRRGDFFTNVSVGPLFGKLLAAQFAEMWERLGKPREFTVVEQGAHDGAFARDALAAARADAPEFFEAVRYAIVEPFRILRERQELTLAEFAQAGRIRHAASLAELDPFCGVHFSNELLDAMPVHLIIFRDGAWRERYVCVSNGGFAFTDGALSTDALRDRVEQISPPAIEGYQTEVNRDVLHWIDALAAKLARGYVLAIDYGWPRADFYDAARKSGTLACCSSHRRSRDPLANAGASDITAHVEFTSLVERAEARGFALAGFTDQHRFMIGLGRRAFPDGTAMPAKELRAFKTLMHPEMLGASFKVLALQKGAVGGEPLTGFDFAPHPRRVLGIK
jgi:SAM-dependent MidA family methyltransferase